MKTTLELRDMAMRKGNLFPGSNRVTAYSDEWYTPPHIVKALGPFDLDPCAGPMLHAARNLSKKENGLKQPWYGRVWLNPPYSTLHEWLERFIAHKNGVALVNARPETQWFQGLCSGALAVLWLRGRVKFSKPDGRAGTATVGSVLVAYGKRNAAAILASKLPGVVMNVKHCALSKAKQELPA